MLFVTTPLSIPVINVNIRMEIWKEMWRTIVNNPIFGIGPRSPFPFSPHNGYLLVGVTSGALGFVSYTILPIILMRRVYRPVSIEDFYILMILCSTLVFQFFEVYNFVGINFDSTVAAVFMGMLITKNVNRMY
jgi:O-antigen ligase